MRQTDDGLDNERVVPRYRVVDGLVRTERRRRGGWAVWSQSRRCSATTDSSRARRGDGFGKRKEARRLVAKLGGRTGTFAAAVVVIRG